MEFNDYGDTIEEWVKGFQSGLMWHTIIRALMLFAVKSMLASLLGHTNTFLYTLVLTALFFKIAYESYKDYDVYSGHEVFTYKGKMHRLREKEPSEVTLELENQIRKNMVVTTTAFVGAGSFVDDMLRLVPADGGTTTLLAYMLLGVLAGTPLWILYLVKYRRMSYLVTTSVVSPTFGMAYLGIMGEDDKTPSPDDYFEWKQMSKRERKKEYTVVENEKLEEVYDTLVSRIDDNVRILPPSVGVNDTLEDGSKEGSVQTDSKEEEIKEYDLSEIDTTYENEGESEDESARKDGTGSNEK